MDDASDVSKIDHAGNLQNGLQEQQTEHEEHDKTDALAAAFDRVTGAEPVADHRAADGGDADGKQHAAVQKIDDQRGDVRREICNARAAGGFQQSEAEHHGERDREERAGAGTDQTVIDADDKADQPAEQQNLRLREVLRVPVGTLSR